MDGINFNLHTNDLFENGDIGLRVKPADPDALADAILKLFNDFELCKKFSENGLKKREEFCTEAITPKCMELYGHYIQSSGGWHG